MIETNSEELNTGNVKDNIEVLIFSVNFVFHWALLYERRPTNNSVAEILCYLNLLCIFISIIVHLMGNYIHLTS